jgi:hypothetical protein
MKDLIQSLEIMGSVEFIDAIAGSVHINGVLLLENGFASSEKDPSPSHSICCSLDKLGLDS